MKRATWIGIVLAVCGAGAWGAGSAYELADSRLSAGASPRRLEKLIVVGISGDREVRNRFEDKFVTHLRGKNIDALASHTLVSDLADPGDRDRILDALAREKVDGAMTIRAVALDDLGEKAWSADWTSWVEAPSTVRDLIRKTVPVPKKKSKIYGIELALWDVETARPLWAARTRPISVNDLRLGVGDLLQLTIESLKETPWLRP